jgi:hypothetical protein
MRLSTLNKILWQLIQEGHGDKEVFVLWDVASARVDNVKILGGDVVIEVEP